MKKTIINRNRAPLASEQDHLSHAREVHQESHEYVPLTIEMADEEALDAFYALPENVLPPNLPAQYRWVKKDDAHCIAKVSGAKDHALTLILYGPHAQTTKINFLFQVDGVTVYSFAHIQRPAQDPQRTYPNGLDFRVPNFNYRKHKYSSHVRGHMIDHADTICSGSSEDWSTYDRRNYTPEPPDYDWGLGIRNQQVKALRSSHTGSAYAQINEYTGPIEKTVDGTPVPSDVRFCTYSLKTYNAEDIYHVEFSENFKRPKGKKVLEHAADTFTTSVAASPSVKSYNSNATDRDLRYWARNEEKKALAIRNGDVYSRFLNKDIVASALSSGNMEFETAGRKLHAGVLAGDQGKTAIAAGYIKHALSSAEKLLEDEEHKSAFNADEKTLTTRYLRKATENGSDDNEDYDGILDRMNQLTVTR